MTRFIGVILNIIFLFAMYASGVGMQYGENILNVMVSLYFIGTMIMTFFLGCLFLPLYINDKTLTGFKELQNILKIRWTSWVFYLIGIPLSAWFGQFGVMGLTLFSLFIIVALQAMFDAVIMVYSEEYSEND